MLTSHNFYYLKPFISITKFDHVLQKEHPCNLHCQQHIIGNLISQIFAQLYYRVEAKQLKTLNSGQMSKNSKKIYHACVPRQAMCQRLAKKKNFFLTYNCTGQLISSIYFSNSVVQNLVRKLL
jgi:hypothetical protein